MNPDPIARFRRLYERALVREPGDPTRFTLATAGADGRPSARVLLLKGFDRDGFVFYSNRESRKGRELAANPWAAMCFHWVSLDWQVRVEGPVEQVPDETSDAYFASRSRDSQLGAWASEQSRPLESRSLLLRRFLAARRRFARRPVPRPPFWGGYRLLPRRVEFWSNRRFRLHDRVLYRRQEDGTWRAERLYP